MATIKFWQEMQRVVTIDGQDKLMIGKNSTGEAQYVNMEDINQYLSILGQRMKSVVPGLLPSGPIGQTRYMQLLSAGTWTFGGVTIATNPEGSILNLWWDGTTWSKDDSILIPKASADGLVKIGELLAPNGDKVATALDTIKKGGEYLSLTLVNGYYKKSDGTFASESLWRSSQLIDVLPDDVFIREGNSVLSSSAGAEILAYNSTGVYLGYVTRTLPEYKFTISKDMPVGTAKIIISGGASVPLKLFKVSQIATIAVEGLDSINDLNNLLKSTNGFDFAKNGYIDSLGNFVSISTWLATEFIPVYEGQNILYSGLTAGIGYPLVGYDSNMIKVSNLLPQGTYVDRVIKIPSGISFIRSSCRNNVGDLKVLRYNGFNQSNVNFSYEISKLKNNIFIPSKIYAKSGEAISFNINGIVNKHPKDYSRDTFFNIGYGNESFLKITPNNDFSIPVRQRLLDNTSIILGTLNVKVKGSVSSPTEPQYFMHFGDSTVKCVANSGIEGAVVNELSRRLTGVGTNINPENAPPALSLNNISFIGTIGDQPIKHEGRGGWSFFTYLNTASGNAFWNNGFDLNYYLTTNNFTGINSTGSNFTMIIQLGWNDIFNYTLTQIETYCKQLLNSIKSSKSGIRVKLVSMQLPPEEVYKTYTGNREQSYISTMNKIIDIARLYERMSLESIYNSWVEHIAYMPTFFPENSYPTVDVKVNNRSESVKKIASDDVHVNAIGYSQESDTLFYNILYNYC